MNSLLRYTNGTGHLVMSIVATMAALLMILVSPDASVRGTGVAIILTVNGYWFVSGAAKQVATEVVSQVATQTQGVQGAQGDQGIQGIQGVQGIQGPTTSPQQALEKTHKDL